MESKDKLTVSIDSQWLSTMQECHRKMKFKFIDNLRPIKKNEFLEKGSLMHEMLDVFYSNYKEPYNTRIEMGVTHGRKLSVTLSLPNEECEAVIFQFKEYCDHYRMDGWLPAIGTDKDGNEVPLIEHTFSIILHEDDDIKIIYSGKIDLVANTPVGLIIVDHKTESRKTEPPTLSNQFIGYANALKIYNVWVNKIGFQKTLSREERFRRIIRSYNPGWIEEWKVGVIHDIKRAAHALQTGEIYPNFTSCDRFTWGCEYKPLCETDADNRVFKARVFYEVGEPWSPYGAEKESKD